MDITILKVVKADHFWAKETPGTEMSEETRRFQQLSQQMNEFFSMEQAICVPTHGQLCVGRRSEDKQWYRVRVKTILHKSTGPLACCFLLDYAEDCQIPCRWLREAPQQFLQLPWQAKEFRLYGLQPLSLSTCMDDFITEKRPCKKYDSAANEYVSKLVKECCGAKVHVHHVDSEGVSHVTLELRKTTNTVCVNNDLVEKEYAIHVTDGEANSPSAASGRCVSPLDTSPPPLSPVPSQQSSPRPAGLALMLGVNPSIVIEPVQTSPAVNTHPKAVAKSEGLHRALSCNIVNPSIVTEPVQRSPAVNTHPKAVIEPEGLHYANVPDNSNSVASPGVGTYYYYYYIESSTSTMKSHDGVKAKISPVPKSRGITEQQMPAGESTTSPSVRGEEPANYRQEKQRIAKEKMQPSLKSAGKNLSPRRILKAKRLSPKRPSKASSGHIMESGAIAVNPAWLEAKSGQGSKWTPGASSPDQFFKPLTGRQEVKSRRTSAQDQSDSAGISAKTVHQVISKSSSRSVESRIDAAYSQTTTLGKEWTNLVDKTSPVSQRPLSPISVNIGATSSNARSTSMQGNNEVSRSQNVSPESGPATGVSDTAASAHTSVEKSADSIKSVMSEGSVHSVGVFAAQAAVVDESARRRGDVTGSTVDPSLSGSSDAAKTSDVKAAASSISGGETSVSGGGGDVSTPSVNTGYTPARLPRINLHGNPLRDSLFPTHSSSGDPSSTTEPSTSEGEESPVRRKHKVPSIGERLLQGLAPQKREDNNTPQAQFTSHSFPPRQLSPASQQMSTAGPMPGDGVAVKGDMPPKPYTLLEKTPFPEFIQQYLRSQNFPAPSKVQAYCWPAIMRGRDLVAMAPAKMGKTLAYLLPVMTQLAQTTGLEGLPEGNGPRAIILCPYWNNARHVYDQCWNYIVDQKSTRVLLIFGAGAEEDQTVPLINGCDLLIATPRCLLRMLEKRYTNLDRLCQLVVDDADTLTEVYTEEIKSLMRLYGKAIAELPDRSASRQIVLMARQWTPGIDSFHKAYMTQPLLVFTSRVEEAVYSKVKQIAQVVHSTQRYTQLLGLLDQLEKDAHRILVFAGSDAEAEDVAKLLKSYSHTTLLAHTDLHQYQIDTVQREWRTKHSRDSLPILVLTDTVIQDLGIRDATCVIHYSFALSPLKFSGRLGCMANSFNQDGSKEKKRRDPCCVSYIMLTEACTTFPVGLQEIMTLVRRSGGDVSQELMDFCDQAWQTKQVGRAEDSFCHALKAFGRCAEQARCKARHVVLPTVDQPGEGMPTFGYVKVLVTHVVDANCYYARVLKHWDWDRRVVSRENTCLPLMADIGLYYSRQDNKVPVATAQVGDLCATRDMQNTFHRVRVTKITATDFTCRARVFYMDEGKTEELEVTKLLQLPEHLAIVPAQAIEVYLCGVCPVDQDKQWTDKASAFTHALVSGKELEGRVALCLGSTLWIESLVERKVLQGIKATTNKHNIRRELVHVALAQLNTDHVSLLRQACDGKIPLPEYKPPSPSKAPPAKPGLKYSTANPPPTATLPESGFEEVYVSAVEHPGLMYVQRKHYINKLETLMEEVNSEDKLAAAPVLQQLAPGRLCVAVFPQDNRWYRARIEHVEDDEMCSVFYLDHGDAGPVPRSCVKEPWDGIMQLPFQAIEASLSAILPLNGQQWTKDSGDELWDMVFEKMLFVQVLSVGPSEHGNNNRYQMELYNTSAEYDIITSQELVMQGHGVMSGSPEWVNMMFPMAADPAWTDSHPDPAEQICLLCAQMCQTSDPDRTVELAKKIESIVINNPTKHEAMRETRGVSSVCLMLGYCTDPAVLESLVVSLGYMVINSQANCDEVRTAGGLRVLCRLLKKDYRPEVQKQLVWALKQLALNDRNKQALEELGGLTTLCGILADTNSLQVQENVCRCLVNLVTDSRTNCSAVADSGGLHTVCQLIKSCTNNTVLEPALHLLQQLASVSSNRAAIAAEGGVQILCEKVEKAHSDKVLVQALMALKALLFRSEENLAVVASRSGVRDIVERHASSPQSSELSRLCKDLLSKLGSPTKSKSATPPAKQSVNHSNFNQSAVRTSSVLPSPQLTSSQSVSGMNRSSHHSSLSQSGSRISSPGSSPLSLNQSASGMNRSNFSHHSSPNQSGCKMSSPSSSHVSPNQSASGMNRSNFSHHSSPNQSGSNIKASSSPVNQSGSIMKKPTLSPKLAGQPTGVNGHGSSHHSNKPHPNSATGFDIKTRKEQVLEHHWTRHGARRPSLEPVPEGTAEPHQGEDVDYDDMPPLEMPGGGEVQESGKAEFKVPSLHPSVLWSQQKETVTLSVQLRGLTHKPDVTFLPTALHFRTVFRGTDYRLDLDLYDKVEPAECSCRVTGSDVLLTLRKEKPGPWLRLSRTKAKHPWLGIDFDRWEDVSSDSESELDTNKNKNVPPQYKHKEKGPLPPALSSVMLPEMDMSSDTNSHLHDSDRYSDSDGEVGGSGYKMNDPRFIGV